MAENINLSDGIKEVTQEVITKLSGLDQHFDKKLIDNVFSFFSCSGGAGTSTLVSNVAYALAKAKFSVLLIDLNITFPIQHMYWSLDQTKEYDLVSLLNGDRTLGECLQYNKALNISFLVPLNRLIIDKAMIDNEQAGNNMQALLEQAASLFDVVLLDLPTYGMLDYEITNDTLYKSDFIYMVLDENVECIASIPRLLKNLNALGIPAQNVRYVMNKRTPLFYPTRVFKQLGIEVPIVIPYDRALIETSLRGDIFISKGASTSSSAKHFVKGILSLKDNILLNGGYVAQK